MRMDSGEASVLMVSAAPWEDAEQAMASWPQEAKGL